MKHLLTFVLFLSNLLFVSVFAQDAKVIDNTNLSTAVLQTDSATVSMQLEKPKSDNSFLSHLSVGLRASTLGVGVQVATPINDYFKLRAGVDFMGFKTGDIEIGLEDPDGAFEKAVGYTPDYNMKGELNFTNGHALVDYHPTKGIFHLTAGFFLGKNQLKAKGLLTASDGSRAELLPGEDWPTVDFDGHQLKVDNANLDATFQLGEVVKPYFGLGIGRAIANKRVAFKFELGAIYQGKYSIKQNGKKINIADNVTENFENIDTYTNILKWWPMLNFQLTYKIF
ncbi:hypothetical protein JGH11_17620 [Dysgonomonas sp. Marseille-P4677]|uniref:hypothetical protein n=1 Tax=Dysgonomonas sp. Marseille-P4677 TaxID=2364790 RepID=UPI001913953B|nr:hypothetical protein [Dysgonomonas sp. Marseille-P4677]MBK5722695.1 hypothetical protein [Dysgonomonas sp. Marseille-P4677]